MHSLMYNKICMSTTLLYINSNSFFCDKVQEAKFLKVFFSPVYDKKFMCSVVIPVQFIGFAMEHHSKVGSS